MPMETIGRVPCDEAAILAGTGEPAPLDSSRSRPSKLRRHEGRETIQTAAPIAIASSRRAIGRSLPPVAFTSRLRNS
jgi:hypothetical protein